MPVGFSIPAGVRSMASLVGLDAAALHDQLLGQMPEGARHDSDLCAFCRGDKATADGPHASVPSGDEPSGAAHDNQHPTTEGGTQDMSDDTKTISLETHEALMAKAVSDAVSATETALATKVQENADLTTKVGSLTTELASAKEDNSRLNKDLDKAQVDLKTATDEAASLRSDNEAKDEAARLDKLATERAEQVKNLQLFPEDYVTEKASFWAKLEDTDWAARVEEWTKAKPSAAAGSGKTDTASAMSGTSGSLTTDTDAASDTTIPARRTVLGLS